MLDYLHSLQMSVSGGYHLLLAFFNVKTLFLLDLLMFIVCKQTINRYGANVSLCKIPMTISKKSVLPLGE